jgi:hypothetical protein
MADTITIPIPTPKNRKENGRLMLYIIPENDKQKGLFI